MRIRILITDWTPDQLNLAYELWSQKSAAADSARDCWKHAIRTPGEHLNRWNYTQYKQVRRISGHNQKQLTTG